MTIAFPDTKITSAPQGLMVANSLKWAAAGEAFEEIVRKLQVQIDGTYAIMVDDLSNLVKGGRLSNGRHDYFRQSSEYQAYPLL